MIRPEAKAVLWRWREVLAGVALAGLGLWWLSGARLLLALPGAALALAGAALIWVGFQRQRFRSAGEGPGAVDVDEGRITYFGPLTGGAVSLRELTRLTLDHGARPAHWVLRQHGQPDLAIPVNADGADQLFDAFATLPGFPMQQALRALHDGGTHETMIWQRSNLASLDRSLH